MRSKADETLVIFYEKFFYNFVTSEQTDLWFLNMTQELGNNLEIKK